MLHSSYRGRQKQNAHFGHHESSILTFSISSSNFCINFFCSLTFSASSVISLSAFSNKDDFSESFTWKQHKQKYNSYSTDLNEIFNNPTTVHKFPKKDIIISIKCSIQYLSLKSQILIQSSVSAWKWMFLENRKNTQNRTNIWRWSCRKSSVYKLYTFNCVSWCSIFRFLSRRRDSILLISSPLVAASQSSASIEL